jgi:protein O-mannosyl-transferase
MAKAKTHERQQRQSEPTAEPVKPAGPGFFQRRLREIAIAAVLAAAVWLIYAQTGGHAYVNFDDWDYVGENLAVLSGLTWEGVKFAFTTKMTANWHPITWLSLMLDVELVGSENPGAMHLMSMWLHAANSILLFILFRYLTGAIWRSAALAFLFAVHPLHVESVAWLSDRKDLLATFFWLLTALTYAYWAKRPAAGPTWPWFALAHVWAALALMSKPTAVTLPFTLLLLDLWPLGRMDNPVRRVVEKAGFFLLAAVQSVVTYSIQRELGATEALTVDLGRRLANVLTSYGVYLWQTLIPAKLTPMYPFPERIALAAAALSIALISALAFRRIRQQPYLAAGWLWYLGVLLPMIGLVQVGIQSHADRYTYVSLIGIFWIAVWGLHEWIGEARWRSGPLQAALVLAGLTLMWQSYSQAALWKDDRTLFGHTLAVTGRNRLANTIVGLSHLREKNLAGAERHLRVALEMEPKFMPAYRHLAEVLYAREKPEEAVKLLDKAVALEPRGTVTYYNRGIVLKSLGRKEEALADFEKALKMGLEPDQAKRANIEAGLIKTSERKYPEALAFFEKALEIDPAYYLAQKNLAFTYYYMKNAEQALYWFKQLAGADPTDQDVINAMATIKKN